MRNTNKKGFTIVELVIVIAIIAVLAAVLIPTFGNVINQARISADTQLLRNLNTALKADNTKHRTMYEALQSAENFGYLVDRINASATNNEILWDSVNDAFCYYNADQGAIEYVPEVTITQQLSASSYKYWAIVKLQGSVATCGVEGMNWSVYLADSRQSVLTSTVGVDAGKCDNITSITYNGNDTAKDVVIRTSSYDTAVTIDAELDTVMHFGKAKSIDVVAVAMSSYHEYGDVAGNINLVKGNVVVEEGCKASAVVIDMTTNQLATVTSISADNTKAEYVPIVLNTSSEEWHNNQNNRLIDPNKNNIIYTTPSSSSVVVKEAGHEDADISNAVAYARNANKYYMNLDTAINSAQENEYIMVLKDNEIYHKTATEVNPISNGVTIDLNNHLLRWEKDAWVTGENLTIKNGKLSGIADTQSYSCFFGDEDATSVVLSNLTCTGGFNFYNTKAVIIACNVTLNAGYNAVWADSNSDVTIESGTYDARNRTTGYGIFGCSNSLLKITGGTYYSNNTDVLLSSSEFREGEYKSGLKGIAITGGRFNVNVNDFTFVLTKDDNSEIKHNQKLLPEGYSITKIDDLWVVTK